MSNINCDKCGHLLPVEGECVCEDVEALKRIQAEAEAAARDPHAPPPGSWADVARMMASLGGDDGIDWDAWKDEMKETDGEGY